MTSSDGLVSEMDCVYGVSRWTNPYRASARHINNGDRKPLCNPKRKREWQPEKAKPTCQRCIKLHEVSLRL